MIAGERLTTSLALEVEKANLALSRWIERKNDWLELSEVNYTQNVEEITCTITALKDHNDQLENTRSLQDKLKSQQKSEIEAYTMAAKTIASHKQDLLNQLLISENEEEKERRRLQIAYAELETLRNQVGNTIDNLSHGLSKYLALGLEFQRGDGESMRFTFTQIDPKQTSKQFYFSIYVDENNSYNLIETYPKLDSSFCECTVSQLNADNNMSKFVVKMRRAFVQIATNSTATTGL